MAPQTAAGKVIKLMIGISVKPKVKVPKPSEVERFFLSENIDYIKTTSEGRLSKYYQQNALRNKKAPPLQVVYGQEGKTPRCISINEATDLFQRYKHTHRVGRIYCYRGRLSSRQGKDLDLILETKI